MQSLTLVLFAALVTVAYAGGQFYVPRAYYTIDSDGHESAPVPLRRLRRSVQPYRPPLPYGNSPSANSVSISTNINDQGPYYGQGYPRSYYGADRRPAYLPALPVELSGVGATNPKYQHNYTGYGCGVEVNPIGSGAFINRDCNSATTDLYRYFCEHDLRNFTGRCQGRATHPLFR